MSSEYSKFYLECEHTIAESTTSAGSTDASNNPQEIVNGQCPHCSDPPRSLLESSIETLPTTSIASYARSLQGVTQEMMGGLRSANSDGARNVEGPGSVQTVSMTSNMNLEEEIAGKENVSTRHSLGDKFKETTVTGGITNAMAAKQSREAIKNLVAHITSKFDTMREKIDNANERMADIDNFRLADFMCQGVERWTVVVKQAIKECEDDLVRECKELAKATSSSSLI